MVGYDVEDEVGPPCPNGYDGSREGEGPLMTEDVERRRYERIRWQQLQEVAANAKINNPRRVPRDTQGYKKVEAKRDLAAEVGRGAGGEEEPQRRHVEGDREVAVERLCAPEVAIR